MLSIHYFASVREAMDRDRDELDLPGDVTNVAELMQHLSVKDGRFAQLTDSNNDLLVAVNHTMVNVQHPLAADDEVAFFPPMTGG